MKILNFELKIEKLTLLSFLSIIGVSFVLFYPSLNYYFFQDDWFVLNWVRTESFKTFLISHEGTIYWRPVSMPLLFWGLYNLFGLNVFFYHLLIFIIFYLLIFAVYKLLTLLTKSKKISLAATFLYATWPVHFISLSWLVATQYILMPLFQTISFIFFIKFVNTQNKNFWFASFTFFVFGILSHEFTLMLPFILFFWGVLMKRENLIKFILPFLFVDLLFLFFRFIIFPIQAVESYGIRLNYLLLDNFLWYIAWAFNLPESFKDLVDQRSPIQSVKILIQYWKIVLPSLISILIILNLIRLYLHKVPRQLIFGTSWLIFGLLPIIAIVNHSYTMYLSFAGLGIILMIAFLLTKTNNLLIYVVAITWITAGAYNLDFSRKTHWVAKEQAVSRAYTEFVLNKVANPKPNSLILFKEADSSFSQKSNFTLTGNLNILKQSLFDQQAMQVIYNDSTIKSYYIQPHQSVNFPQDVAIYDFIPTP